MTKNRHALSDEKWALVLPFIPKRRGRHGGDECQFIDAVLWIACTGSPWRDLPEKLGRWDHVYQRFAYRRSKGHFESIFQAVQKPDMEEAMIDSTSCKAHHRRAPGLKKWSSITQSIGASCGGLNAKIHAVCDALGNPPRFKLTPGNRSDVAELPAMISSLRAGALLADKGYGSNAAVELAESLGMEAVIPPRPSRKKPRAFDAERDSARHLAESLFQGWKCSGGWRRDMTSSTGCSWDLS